MQMDSELHRKIQKYIDSCLPIMNLSEWQVELIREYKVIPQAWAAIAPHTVYKRAFLALTEKVLELDRESVRAIIAHELSHLLTVPLAEGHSEFAVESTTETIARSMASFLPLPPRSICGDKRKSDFIN